MKFDDGCGLIFVWSKQTFSRIELKSEGNAPGSSFQQRR